jgi:hypothetical protein
MGVVGARPGARWVKVVAANPEALVYIDQRSRTETSQTDDKGNVTVTHTYRIQGSVDVAGLRAPIAAEGEILDSPGAYRDDAAKFSLMSSEVASRALGIIGSRLDVLRPNRAQTGFTFQAKYRFGVKGDGLEVTSVTPGGPAEQAGLRVKDRIRSINGEKGTDQMSFLAQYGWIDGPGRRYQIQFDRDKKPQTGELTTVGAGQSSAMGTAPSAPHTTGVTYAPPPAAAAAPAPRSAGTAARASTASSGGDVELKVGMTEADLVRGMGQPQKKVSFGPKSVWTYDGFTVTLVGGKVTDIK